MSWGVVYIRADPEAAKLAEISKRLLTSGPVPFKELHQVLKYLDAREGSRDCADRALPYVALLRQYGAAAALGADRKKAPNLLAAASADIRAYLACSPSEGFFWYLLFWVETQRGVDLSTTLRYLELSYDLAPYEGWVAAFRTEDALPHLTKMWPSLQRRLRAEWAVLSRDRAALAAALRDRAPEHVRLLLSAS